MSFIDPNAARSLGHRLADPSPLTRELRYASGPWHVTGAIILGTAAAGAYSAHQQAQAANKPHNSQTSQTTTQTPYMWPNVNAGLEEVLNAQRQMAARGAPQVDARGNITYAPIPGMGGDATPASTPAGPTPKPGSPAAGTSAGGTWVNARGETMRLGPNGKAVKVAPGSVAATAAAAPAGPNLSTPQGIFGAVAARGLDAGNTPTVTGARNVMDNIWGAAGDPNSATAGDPSRSGFEGYNPILDRLSGTLESDVSQRNGRDLLLGFLNENSRGGGSPSGSSGSGPTPRYGTNVSTNPGSPAWVQAQGLGNQGGGTGANGRGVPDTVGGNDSFFAQQTQHMFDEGANNTELQAVIDSMTGDVQRGMYRDLATLDASAQGTGRFGGDMWKGLSSDARGRAAEEMTQGAAQVRVGDREARRQALLAALGQVNTRDLGLLGANVQREGIAAGERSANAGAAASAAGMQGQLDLARRGQDLSAIGELLGNERNSLNQLGQVGGQLSGDILGATGMVPGLEGVGLSGLNAALGAGGGLVDMRGQDTALRQSQIGAATARQGMAQQLGLANASAQQASVNDYLRTLMGIGGMGGTSTTSGTNVQPGLGVSPTGAAFQGLLGGAATGAGLASAYRGY